jgi:hypothetical protein
MESKIKLVDESTDLSNVKPYDWDLVIYGMPYYVCKLNGYVHTISSNSENDLWCYPRNKKPSYENLREFNGIPVEWGFYLDAHNRYFSKYEDEEVTYHYRVTITRNKKSFYDFIGNDVTYCIGKAMHLIAILPEHPLQLQQIDFDKKMIGRKVYWRDSPAIIDRYVDGQACVILKPDGMNKFPVPAWEKAEKDGDEPAEEIKTEIFDKNIWWFRD